MVLCQSQLVFGMVKRIIVFSSTDILFYCVIVCDLRAGMGLASMIPYYKDPRPQNCMPRFG